MYDVPPPAFLFRNAVEEAKARKAPEEPVRQWCAFELIRAYGVPVGELQFEAPVKIGSRPHRIDIVVKREGRPWIVVECKEPGFKKPSDALRQATSYADNQAIQAEFVLYTNGSDWIVLRRMRGVWIPVPDLPLWREFEAGNELVHILQTISMVAPVLHTLDQPLKDEEARKFAEKVQRFFCGTNHITEGINKELRSALDNLFRVIQLPRDDVPYQVGKLSVVHMHLERFGKRTGLPYEADIGSPSPNQIHEMFHQLSIGLSHIMPTRNDPLTHDALALRLCLAGVESGKEIFDPIRPRRTFGVPLQNALRELLEFGLTTGLDWHLPDALDTAGMKDLRLYTFAGINPEID